jgi:TDG/mug DNA glycosylase family protein
VQFTREELEQYRDSEVDDVVGRSPELVFVGINPGLWTAATNTHFAHPSNRFYPALHLAGITGVEVDRSAGFTAADRERLTGRGVAITNLVARATARADELTADEYRAGADALVERLEGWRPAVVAFVGITAYRTAFGRRGARKGRQPDAHAIAGADVFALGNPSGLNAHETVESLARDYREAAEAAGIPLDAPRW